MLKMAHIQYIKDLYENEEKSLREIARETGHHFSTVKKYAQEEDWNKKQMPGIQPESYPVLGGYIPVIDEWMEEDQRAPRNQRHTSTRIYDRLVEEQKYAGSYSSVRRYVRRKRILMRQKVNEGSLPISQPQGHAQVDFGKFHYHNDAGKDIMPGNSWEDPDKAHMQSPSDIAIWDYHDFLLPYFKQAAFVSDYRRIYELYPRDNWIFPSATPSAQTPSSPLVDKKTHAVSTASQLHEAISKSKSGDTILVLCDIYTDQSIHVKNKKLTITGYGDSTPTIVNDMHNLNGINNHLFYLDKATVTIKNLKLTSTNQMDCFYLKQSSLILGSGCEIFGMLDVAFLAGKSALTVDGASIYHNTGSICSDGASLKAVGQLTLTSGEIAYNNTDGVLIAVNTFTMSGGEIHHNISNALRITGLINPGMGKSEVSGGSISDNYSNAGVIMLNGGTLIISGGEITRNISSNYTGGINVSGFALSGRQYPAKVRMSSGRIYDNEVRHPMPASYWMATLGYNLNSHYEKAGNNLILHEMYAEQYVTDATLEMSGGQIYSRRGLSRNSSIIVSGTKSKATLSGKAEVETSSILVQNGGKLTDKRK